MDNKSKIEGWECRLIEVQGLMGHEDLSTTSIYINLAPKERIEQYKERFLTRE
jgi:site-specific recombinase XerD